MMRTSTRILYGILEVIRGLAGIVLIVAVFAGIVAGSAIAFFSKAPQQVKVPDLRGMTVAEARSVLEEKGLTFEVSGREYSAQVEQDRVIETRPYAGKHVKPGRVVEGTVSLGGQYITVPKVTGMALATARRRLRDSGLSVDVVRKVASDAPVGQVLAQSPAARKKIARAGRIELNVSGGPGFGRVAIPDEPDWVFKRLRITVPSGRALQRVQIISVDDAGEETSKYDRVHRPGDEITVKLAGREGWLVRVLLQGKQIYSEEF